MYTVFCLLEDSGDSEGIGQLFYSLFIFSFCTLIKLYACRYFNRVHTGFEWNKYNQTHYDFDNPPPKIVQGYKFNIFFPDLIDKSITPEFREIYFSL